MEQLIERFKLISAAINLNEYEIISSQTEKLLTFSLDSRANDIVKSLQMHSYDDALLKIKSYSKNVPNISNIYKDPKAQELQIQLRTLEMDLGNLYEEKNEYLSNINEFITLYQYYLHDELKNILKQKLQNAKTALLKRDISKERYEELSNQYNILNEQTDIVSQKKPNSLNQKDAQELKNLYKKANRVINPDILTDNEKKRTQKMFKALNRAYTNKDLATIKKIQKTIEENPRVIYGFDKIDDITLLRAQSKSLQSKIIALKEEIETIKKSDIYKFLNSTKNLEQYFMSVKEALITQKTKIVTDLI